MSRIHFLLYVSILAAPLGAQTVGSTTSLSVSQSSISPGTIVTLTATVSVNGQPANAGQVHFLDGKRDLGTVQIVVSGSAVGTATMPTRSLQLGENSITAVFSGAINSAQASGPNQSSAVSVTVTGAPIDVSSMTLAVGTPFLPSLSATLAGLYAAPTGSISFLDSTTDSPLGTTELAATTPVATVTSYATSGAISAMCAGDFDRTAHRTWPLSNPRRIRMAQRAQASRF